VSSASSLESVVIGAGHAGLAVSRRLTDAGIEHIVLERGEIGESSDLHRVLRLRGQAR
jgi:putative flavoprotein involved in K+ transport